MFCALPPAPSAEDEEEANEEHGAADAEKGKSDDDSLAVSDGQPTVKWHFVRIFCVWEQTGPTKAVVIDMPSGYVEGFVTAVQEQQDLVSTPYMLHACALVPVIDIHMENARELTSQIVWVDDKVSEHAPM